MSRLLQPTKPVRQSLNDPRSTGAAAPIRSPDILALRGTLKGKS
jgi:hypothetical protein